MQWNNKLTGGNRRNACKLVENVLSSAAGDFVMTFWVIFQLKDQFQSDDSSLVRTINKHFSVLAIDCFLLSFYIEQAWPTHTCAHEIQSSLFLAINQSIGQLIRILNIDKFNFIGFVFICLSKIWKTTKEKVTIGTIFTHTHRRVRANTAVWLGWLNFVECSMFKIDRHRWWR